MIEEGFMLEGIDGELDWVNYVGKLGDKNLYQVSHSWLYGDKGETRAGVIPIEFPGVDIRFKDPRPHRPYIIFVTGGDRGQAGDQQGGGAGAGGFLGYGIGAGVGRGRGLGRGR